MLPTSHSCWFQFSHGQILAHLLASPATWNEHRGYRQEQNLQGEGNTNCEKALGIVSIYGCLETQPAVKRLNSFLKAVKTSKSWIGVVSVFYKSAELQLEIEFVRSNHGKQEQNKCVLSLCWCFLEQMVFLHYKKDMTLIVTSGNRTIVKIIFRLCSCQTWWCMPIFPK